MQDYTAPLDAALKKAARDGGGYLAGQHAFHAELMRTKDVKVALDGALKAAAHDGGSYQAGENAFWEVQNASFSAKLTTWIDQLKHKVGLNGTTVFN